MRRQEQKLSWLRNYVMTIEHVSLKGGTLLSGGGRFSSSRQAQAFATSLSRYLEWVDSTKDLINSDRRIIGEWSQTCALRARV